LIDVEGYDGSGRVIMQQFLARLQAIDRGGAIRLICRSTVAREALRQAIGPMTLPVFDDARQALAADTEAPWA
jgi:hypothetical protein